MDNFFLFIMGIAITLICGMGVLVYCVALGYKKEQKKVAIIEPAGGADFRARLRVLARSE